MKTLQSWSPSKIFSPALILTLYLSEKEVLRAILLLTEIKVKMDLFLYCKKNLSSKSPKTKLSLEQKSRLKHQLSKTAQK